MPIFDDRRILSYFPHLDIKDENKIVNYLIQWIDFNRNNLKTPQSLAEEFINEIGKPEYIEKLIDLETITGIYDFIETMGQRIKQIPPIRIMQFFNKNEYRTENQAEQLQKFYQVIPIQDQEKWHQYYREKGLDHDHISKTKATQLIDRCRELFGLDECIYIEEED